MINHFCCCLILHQSPLILICKILPIYPCGFHSPVAILFLLFWRSIELENIETNLTFKKDPDRMHPRSLRKPANDIATPLSIILGGSFKPGRFLNTRRKQIPIFKEGKEEDRRNCRSRFNHWERLCCNIPGNHFQIIKNNMVTGSSSHGFMKA